MDVSAGLWAATILGLIAIIVIDLIIVDRRPHAFTPQEATRWVIFYVSMAGLFAIFISVYFGLQYGGQFVAGYLMGLSLEGWNPHAEPPVTEAKREMARDGRSELQAIVEDAIEAGTVPDVVNAEDWAVRLNHAAGPRGRGISGRSFDGRGNYNIGVKEQIIFPEIEYDKIDAIRGMNISITTSAKNDDECKALLTAFKFPFKN